jgi:alkylation response protein AidB-like acyl-CoA dehydrogenase
MSAPLLSRRDLEFYLYELFEVESLASRERYADHNRESFNAAMDIAEKVAEEYFVPIRAKVDMNQPDWDGEKVIMIPEIKRAYDAVAEAGLICPDQDYDMGGMQLPLVVAACAMGYLTAAASTTNGFHALTAANANLLETHGTQEQIDTWVSRLRTGEFAGTMALSEPQAGSSLADMRTKAVPQADGTYRLFGNKIWISGGDHELSSNIVHAVLARIEGAPAGVKGISLFICPKFLLNDDGSLGARNDVQLAGLFHKMGGRGQTSTALNFGENDGAVAYLVGEPHQGLKYMFHMMNEARVMVGTSGATLAMCGYQYSLEYARERPQGRKPSSKDPLSEPVMLIEHADIRRMLLAQKAYAEGSWSLCLFASQLVDDWKTHPEESGRQAAFELLDFLTPIVKTWPSEYGPKANDLAIQVLGGAGYTNDHPVELMYRDNRLNPIHEGTTGIQSLDLLGRKVPQNGMAGYQRCIEGISADLQKAEGIPALVAMCGALDLAVKDLQRTTTSLLSAMTGQDIDLVMANSVRYLELFGHVVVGWMWLRQGMTAAKALEKASDDDAFYKGKVQAMNYFARWELPQTAVWANLLCGLDDTTYAMQADWF